MSTETKPYRRIPDYPRLSIFQKKKEKTGLLGIFSSSEIDTEEAEEFIKSVLAGLDSWCKENGYNLNEEYDWQNLDDTATFELEQNGKTKARGNIKYYRGGKWETSMSNSTRRSGDEIRMRLGHEDLEDYELEEIRDWFEGLEI